MTMAWQRHMTDNIVKVLFKSSEMALELVSIRQQVERMESHMDSLRVDAVVDRLGATAPASHRWFWSAADNSKQHEGILTASQLGKVLDSSTHGASELQAVKEQVGRVELLLTEQQEQAPKREVQQGLASEVAAKLEDRLASEIAQKLEVNLAKKLDNLQQQQHVAFEELMTLSIKNRESEMNVREVLEVCHEAAEGIKEWRKTTQQAEIAHVQSQAMEIVENRQHGKQQVPFRMPRLSDSSVATSCPMVLETAIAPHVPPPESPPDYYMSRHLEDIVAKTPQDLSPQEESVHRLLRCLNTYASILVLASMAYLGIDLLVGMPYAVRGEDPPHELAVVDHCFTVGFVLEILTRISVERQRFYKGPGRAWNFFALIVTAFQVYHSLFGHYNVTVMRVAGISKVVRITTLFRTIKHMRIFRLILGTSTWQPILWGAVTMCGFMFVFAIILGQIVQAGIREHVKAGQIIHPQVLEFYGNLPRIMATLFMAVTGGDPWRESIWILGQVANEATGECIFVVYVFVMTFGVMNTINAVYIDRLMHHSEHSRFVAMSESALRDKHRLSPLRELLTEYDPNSNGKIRYDEFSKAIHDRQAQDIFHNLDLEVHAVMALFRLLEDANNCASVDIDEFMNSLAGLHEGSATQLLLSTLVFRGQLQLQRLANTSRTMDTTFTKVYDTVTKVEGDLIQLLTTVNQHFDRNID